MTGWTVTFLVAALLAAMLGYGGIDGSIAAAARAGFVVALGSAAIAGGFALRRRRRRQARLQR